MQHILLLIVKLFSVVFFFWIKYCVKSINGNRKWQSVINWRKERIKRQHFRRERYFRSKVKPKTILSTWWQQVFFTFVFYTFLPSSKLFDLICNVRSCSHVVYSFIHPTYTFINRLKFLLPEIRTEYYLSVDILLTVAVRTHIRSLLSTWWLTMIKATMWLPYFL